MRRLNHEQHIEPNQYQIKSVNHTKAVKIRVSTHNIK